MGGVNNSIAPVLQILKMLADSHQPLTETNRKKLEERKMSLYERA